MFEIMFHTFAYRSACSLPLCLSHPSWRSTDSPKVQMTNWSPRIPQQKYTLEIFNNNHNQILQQAVEIFESIKTIQILAVENYFIERIQSILESRKKPHLRVVTFQRFEKKIIKLQKSIFRALFHALSQSFSFFSNFLACSKHRV